MNQHVAVEHVTKRFSTRNGVITALADVTLSAGENEFVSLIGPSGCGKSTLLQMIGGLERPTSGTIRVNGESVTGPGADRGMVFQTYTLFPWLTVQKNIEFGLRLRNVPPKVRAEIARQLLVSIGLERFGDAYPYQLSGGMKQRVAIARALANRPRVLLMDEPFGALDAQTRLDMQVLLRQVWSESPTTVVFVTHDIEEAVFLSERIYVLSAHPGRLKAEFTVPLPGKRDIDMKDTEAAISLRREIFHLLKDRSA